MMPVNSRYSSSASAGGSTDWVAKTNRVASTPQMDRPASVERRCLDRPLIAVVPRMPRNEYSSAATASSSKTLACQCRPCSNSRATQEASMMNGMAALRLSIQAPVWSAGRPVSRAMNSFSKARRGINGLTACNIWVTTSKDSDWCSDRAWPKKVLRRRPRSTSPASAASCSRSAVRYHCGSMFGCRTSQLMTSRPPAPANSSARFSETRDRLRTA